MTELGTLAPEDFEQISEIMKEMLEKLNLYETTGVEAFGEQADALAHQYSEAYERLTGEPFVWDL